MKSKVHSVFTFGIFPAAILLAYWGRICMTGNYLKIFFLTRFFGRKTSPAAE